MNPEFFTFDISKKGWHISYPYGKLKKHKVDKLNRDVKTFNILYNNSDIRYIDIIESNSIRLGDIKTASLFKRRNNYLKN